MRFLNVAPSYGTTYPYISPEYRLYAIMGVLCFLTVLSEVITWMLGGNGKLKC